MNNEQTNLFAKWLLSHQKLAPSVVNYSEDPSASPRKNLVNQILDNFFDDRKLIHQKEIKKLKKFIKENNALLKKFQKEFSVLSEKTLPKVEYLCYNDNNFIIFIRKYIFVQQLIYKTQIKYLNHKIISLKSKIDDAQDLLELFTSDNILPDEQAFSVIDFYENFDFKDKIEKYERQINALNPLKDRMEKVYKKLPKAQWATDYPGFISQIIESASKKVSEDMAYFYSNENEIALSRCYFCHGSPFKENIDNVLNEINNQPSPKLFIKQMVIHCFMLMPNREKMTNQELSICLLMFYRTLFNRVYELFHELFAPKFPDEIIKIEKMSNLQADEFEVPLDMVHHKKMTKKESMHDLFAQDKLFSLASKYMELALFMSNPIDALFFVNKSIVKTSKAALINRGIIELCSDEEFTINEKNYCIMDHDEIENDIKQMICFDDMFVLLLGTVFCSDKPDIFFLSWFISNFLPKQFLTPSFEYASANLEALADHCLRFEFKEKSILVNDQSQ